MDFGKLGPGAVYETKSSFGKQVDAKKRSPASVGFGSADGSCSPPRHGPSATQVPGPGSPLTSRWQADAEQGDNGGVLRFGTSTRDHAEKVFIGKEQAKVFFRMESPGPAAYKVSPAWQAAEQERHRTGFTIQRRPRERRRHGPSPELGAGQYRTVASGAQPRRRTGPRPSTASAPAADGANKVFLGKEQAKVFLGMGSAGPASLGPKAFGGTGKPLSTRSAPKATFGTGIVRRQRQRVPGIRA